MSFSERYGYEPKKPLQFESMDDDLKMTIHNVLVEFEKSIDTTIDESTIHVSYYFPQDSFKIRFQTAIKEIMRTDTVKSIIQIPLYKEDKVKYYSVGVAGFGVGLLIGVLIKWMKDVKQLPI